MIPKGGVKPNITLAFSPGSLVMYENDGAPILAVVLAWKKSRYALLNDRGREIELDSIRLHDLPGKLPGSLTTNQEKIAYLTKLREDAHTEKSKITLEEIWAQIESGGEEEISTSEISKLYYNDDSLNHHIAIRFSLLEDPFFFKRKKENFVPRPASVVEELRRAESHKKQRARLMDEVLSFLTNRVKDPTIAIPDCAAEYITLLEDIAVTAPHVEQNRQKEAKEFLDRCCEALKIDPSRRMEERAFIALEKIHHFTQDQNLSIIRNRPPLSFSEAALKEAANVRLPRCIGDFPPEEQSKRVDLTELFTFTIDDSSTKDMDDALSIEQVAGGYRFGIHISDVASLIPVGSELDKEVRHRATSIYLPEGNINMFPPILSEEKISLKEGEVRPAISCLIETTRDFNITKTTVVPSLIKSREKLSYTYVDQVLEQGYGKEDSPKLDTLYQFAVEHETKRLDAGGIKINKHEANIVLDSDGDFHLVEIDEHAPSRLLVAEMAVLANSTFADFAVKNGFPLVFRGQNAPDEDSAEVLEGVPEGRALDYAMRSRLKRSTGGTSPQRHATLGLKAYAQITSPIRRYIDLCNQRQILSFILTGKALYSAEELESAMMEVEEPLSVAQTVSRETKRYWILKYLERIWKSKGTLEGIVTRTDLKNPIVELDHVYVTFPVRMSKMPPLGTRVTVKVGGVEPRWDYVKLEGAV